MVGFIERFIRYALFAMLFRFLRKRIGWVGMLVVGGAFLLWRSGYSLEDVASIGRSLL